MTVRVTQSVLRYPPAMGGVEQYVADIVGASTAIGIKAHVVTTDLADHQIFSRLSAPSSEGVSRIRAESPRRGAYPRVPGLLKALDSSRPDILHIHAVYYPMFDLPLLRRAWKVPTVANTHAYLRAGRKGAAYRRMVGVALTVAAKIVADSAFEAQVLVERFGVKASRIDIIPPLVRGTAVRAFEPDKIVFVGRLDHGKGVLDLPLLVRHLHLARQDFRLHIMGATSAGRASLEHEIGLLEPTLRERVKITPDAPAELITDEVASAALFIAPSRYEAFGIAAVEALASGVPLVCYNTGAIPTLITDVADGTVVPLGDVVAFSNAVRERLADTEGAAARQARRMRYSARFGPDRWVSSWKSIYSETVH